MSGREKDTAAEIVAGSLATLEGYIEKAKKLDASMRKVS
jgi:hypothetical protein